MQCVPREQVRLIVEANSFTRPLYRQPWKSLEGHQNYCAGVFFAAAMLSVPEVRLRFSQQKSIPFATF